METFKLWNRLQVFDESALKGVPSSEGVYVIDYNMKPFYVGYSNDLHRRLIEHLKKRGSRKINDGLKLGWSFSFTYAEIMSYQQAEAILLDNLGTIGLGNLRRETDPQDKWELRDLRLKHCRAATG